MKAEQVLGTPRWRQKNQRPVKKPDQYLQNPDRDHQRYPHQQAGDDPTSYHALSAPAWLVGFDAADLSDLFALSVCFGLSGFAASPELVELPELAVPSLDLSLPLSAILRRSSDLKSVSYQPPPARRKLAADILRLSAASPHAGQSVSGASDNFCSRSSSSPQLRHTYS